MPRAAILRDVAGVVVAATVAAGLVLVPSVVGAPLVIAAVVLIAGWIAWQDLTDFTIPDGAVVALAMVAAAGRVAADRSAGLAVQDTALLLAVDAGLAGGALWIVREVFFRRRGFDGLGFGDVKLAAAGAMLVGSVGFSLALFTASLAGIAWAMMRRPTASGPDLAGSLDGTTPPAGKVAFGAVLAPAVALVFLVGQLGIAPSVVPASGG
jgi:hypothetical protein